MLAALLTVLAEAMFVLAAIAAVFAAALFLLAAIAAVFVAIFSALDSMPGEFATPPPVSFTSVPKVISEI